MNKHRPKPKFRFPSKRTRLLRSSALGGTLLTELKKAETWGVRRLIEYSVGDSSPVPQEGLSWDDLKAISEQQKQASPGLVGPINVG